MADVQKPIVSTEAPVIEPTPAPAVDLAADKPTETVEPAVEEPAKTEGETVAPVEEKKEEKPVEPIYSGTLGYKAPGLKNFLRFSKKYFWFGEEAVPASSLSQYLRGEKDVEHAHTVAAWSTVTGKGLLYFAKHADQNESPAGVLKLADATDLTKDGTVAFFFKLHGHKHAFEAQTAPERNGWFVAVEKAVEEAKAAAEGIVANETYTEQLTKLGKPAPLAATSAKESTAPKKSTDAAPKLAETEAPATEAAAPIPARTGSASSGSADEEKKKKAAKSKSRSVSRGKRASIFGGFLGKKEKHDEKKEEKAEEKKEEEAEVKKEDEPVAPLGEASTVTAPVIVQDLPKPVEEAKPIEETSAPVAAPVAEDKPKVEEKPKPTKRGSIFGNFVEKLKSPTTEKKESELVPAPISKEPEVAAEAPKIEEPVAPVTDGAAEAPKVEKAEETKPTATTPHKEKSSFSFGKFLGTKEKAKSPITEKTSSEAPKLEDPVKADEAPVLAPIEPVAPVEPVAEAPKEEAAPIGVTSTATATTPQKKRGSIFGNLTGGSVKKEKDGEASEKPKGLSGLFRSASKATKAKKEEKTPNAPAKVEETSEPKEEAPVTEEKKVEAPAVAEPNSIGDVVPDAVTVGQAPKSTTEVTSTA